MCDTVEEIDENCSRSRFALFINASKDRKRPERYREPSRIPIKAIKKALKQRKYRKKIRNYVCKTVPKTSMLFHVMHISTLRKAIVFGKRTLEKQLDNYLTGNSKYAMPTLRNSLPSKREMIYKNVNHGMTHISKRLSGDIETNPGPYGVDPLRTIRAPYSQGNHSVFGPNAGTQCVAMSLAALLYNSIYKIRSSSDLVQIMDIGNELYTHLSRSARQEYLMLTEIPEALCAGKTTYNLQCSESFFGNIHHLNAVIEDNHCLPLQQAFESLLRGNYKSFILTITIMTVAIFQTEEGLFKVFDSHSRNSEGMNDPFGTCVLIELASLEHLIEYFQGLYTGSADALYEVKGVQILTNVVTTTEIPDFSATQQYDSIKQAINS